MTQRNDHETRPADPDEFETTLSEDLPQAAPQETTPNSYQRGLGGEESADGSPGWHDRSTAESTVERGEGEGS